MTQKTIVAWKEILKCLENRGRESTLGAYKARGHTADSWRLDPIARGCMADLLTRLEDELELEASRAWSAVHARKAIKIVRRRLELELL